MTTTWQFVDSIASAPSVRLDLNTLSGIFLADDPTMTPPELKRTGVSSMLDDGESIAASAYANRTIQMKVNVGAGSTDLLATSLQTLARELARPGGNILRVGLATNPMFFRTYPAPDTDFLYRITDPRMGYVTINIPCEPFGYGLEEVLTLVTVTNNPAAGANGQFFDVAAPKGDVETPLYMQVGGNVGATGRMRTAVSVRRRGTVSACPQFIQAETLTAGTDTVVQANNASFSGAGSNFMRVTPGTTSMVTRLTTSGRYPSAPSTDARGTYKVYVRVRQNVAGDVWAMRLLWGSSGYQVVGDTVTLPTGNTNLKYIDLTPGQELMQIPIGYDPVFDGLSGVELPTEGNNLQVQAQRVSGSGTLDIDVLLTPPADDVFGTIWWPAFQAFSTDTYVVGGGRRPTAYGVATSGAVTAVEPIELAGGGLMITPGRTNRVFFLQDIGQSTSGGDVITKTMTVVPSYFPRYLFPLKPATT